MRPTDLMLTVSQRKLTCVLDPALALGYAHGPMLALRLTRVFETWLTRSFWQVVDSSDLLAGRLGERCAEPRKARFPIDISALSTWISMRDTTDAASWRLRWMGDCVAESQVRDGDAPDLLERYELLAGALAACVHPCGGHAATWVDGLDPTIASLDAAALSATLDGAPVLSVLAGLGEPLPWTIEALERANIPVTTLDPVPPETLFAAEQQLVRDALVSVGLACIATTLPPLAVVHVLVGVAANAGVAAESFAAPWGDARAWWYRV